MEAVEAAESGSPRSPGAAELGGGAGGPFSGRTAWARRMETPLRTFLRTETGSASVLAAATVLALIWANISLSVVRPVLGDPARRVRRRLEHDA